MEITAHSGAGPDHAKWQGKIVSLSGRKGYLSKFDIGYGTGDGFGDWNCRHDWFPFFEGYSRRNYSKKQLEAFDEKNIEYNGKLYNQYEISQIQRRYEREIRAAKREQVAFKVAVEEADDPELQQVMQDSLNYANSLVKDKQAKMRDFIRQTGQNRDYLREQNYLKESSRKDLTSVKNNDIIGEEKIPKYLESKPKLNSIAANNLNIALMSTNPNFWTEDKRYKVNCQRCAPAYDARRRGYDVTAKPASPRQEPLKNMTHPKGWANVYEGGIEAVETITGGTGTEQKNNICKIMSEYGSGSRAIVRVRWKDGDGHVFIAEQVNEKTHFIDPQCSNADVSSYLNDDSIELSETRLLRIDDKEFTELIEECVE